MRKDHRPYIVKHLQAAFVEWYTQRYLRPHFRRLGKSPTIVRPWTVTVFGYNVEMGDFPTVISEKYLPVSLVSWAQADLEDLALIIGKDKSGWHDLDQEAKAREKQKRRQEGEGAIRIGDYALICPGVRIQAARGITIGSGTMMAQGSYITDADWHGIYDRCLPVGQAAPVSIGENCWIGDHAIVCKGVTVGDNSIVGAGSVVVRDIPPNCVAVGNPARVVRELDPDVPVRGRGAIFEDYEGTVDMLRTADRDAHAGNSIFGWLRYILAPRDDD
ncbi:MAG: acyltransferase [Desulfatibacillaceae bacterium]